jgi:hypothetical protein
VLVIGAETEVLGIYAGPHYSADDVINVVGG